MQDSSIYIPDLSISPLLIVVGKTFGGIIIDLYAFPPAMPCQYDGLVAQVDNASIKIPNFIGVKIIETTLYSMPFRSFDE